MTFWKSSTKSTRRESSGEERSFASGELEYELSGEAVENYVALVQSRKKKDVKLIVAFVSLIVTGTGYTIFLKLQTLPLYNYANFINIFGCALFIPICFSYVIPASRYGWFNNSVTQEQLSMSKRPFAIMGALDCVAGLMQLLAAVYLPGPLLVLLPQAAIPVSMIFSRHILGERYRWLQYLGAAIVLAGIAVVLEPEITHRHHPDNICEALDLGTNCLVCQDETTEEGCLSHRLDDGGKPATMFDFLSSVQNISMDDDEGKPVCEWIPAATTSNGGHWLVLLWSCIMILSCIPMTLSTIYKEIALEDHVDPVFLNGWVVIFQTTYSLVLAIPTGMASTPTVFPGDVPKNIWNGFLCYLGRGSIQTGCHPDDHCDQAALLFNLSLVFNVLYILNMMFVIKLGSTSLLFLALTIMVPVGNLIFALLPGAAPVHASDLIGLAVILGGLVLYRFSGSSSQDVAVEEVVDSSPETWEPSSEVSFYVDAQEDEDPLAPSSSTEMLREPLLATPRTGDV
jgi:drug/metabolite transporter (DMT)-like permease